MKKHSSTNFYIENSLEHAVKIFLSNKIYILLILLSCISISYLVGKDSNKKLPYNSEIVINEPNIYSLININPDLDANVNSDMLGIFNNKLLSRDNIEKFLDQSDSFENFKQKLLNENTSAKYYFQNRFGQKKIGNKIIKNTFFLVFPESLQGDKFLNEYVIFAKDEAKKEYKDYVEKKISAWIIYYKYNLKIAERVGIENPNSSQFLVKQSEEPDVSLQRLKPSSLYLRGSKVLSFQISQLQNLLEGLDKDLFEFNPIQDSATKPIKHSKNILSFLIFGLMIGAILSIFFVFTKRLLYISE